MGEIAPLLGSGFTVGGDYKFWQNDSWSASFDFGIFEWESEIVSVSDVGVLKSEFDGTDLYLGGQLFYSISSGWDIGLGYRNYHMEESVHAYSVGVTYKF
ncbi:hypothetical protein [Pseudoalteromonas sp. GB56]